MYNQLVSPFLLNSTLQTSAGATPDMTEELCNPLYPCYLIPPLRLFHHHPVPAQLDQEVFLLYVKVVSK